MVDNAAFADVQPLAVLVGRLPDRDVDIAVLDRNGEWKDRTPGGFPVLFGV